MSPTLTHHITLRTFLQYATVLLVVVAFVAYVVFQARFIIAGPQITIFTESGQSQEQLVTIAGQATNIVNISLNGRPIYTDEDGYFKETVVLENGYTISTIRAKDRYGRTVTTDRAFVYTPSLADNS